MLKIFSTSCSAELAANDLNRMFNEWIKDLGKNSIEIIDFKITSNDSGWMLVVHYKILRF